MKRLLGREAQTHTGPEFGVGVWNSGGEPAALALAADGAVTAVVGPDSDAGSSFSFDPASRRLILTRDPFGLHGLYTAQIGDALWCASNPLVLQRLPGMSHSVDPIALHGYLCFSYVPTPLTLTSGIRALPAGARAVMTPEVARCESTAAWREAEPSALSEEQAVIELRERLRSAVRRRLSGEREVGVFLSGGLDSSLIAALLVEQGVKVSLFTLDFGPPFDAELPSARQVAAHLGQPLHRVPARPAQVRAALRATAAALEQPFGDGVTVPLYLLGQAAAGIVGTVFNGEGGDQLFGGWANKPLVAAELYSAGGYDRVAAYLQSYHRFHGLTDSLYTPRARTAVGDPDVGAWVRPALNAEGFTSLLHRLRAANLWLKGAQNIAPRAAQLAAAHGLRMRAPFFDRSLTEWTFSLPPDWFLRGACEKHLLKRAAEPFLPPEIIGREKRGMGVPVTEWCLGPLRREVARWLSARRLKPDGWFEPAAVAALRRGEDHPGEFRRRRVGEKLWALLMLQVWRDA